MNKKEYFTKAQEIASCAINLRDAKEQAKEHGITQKLVAEIFKKQKERFLRQKKSWVGSWEDRLINLYLSHCEVGYTGINEGGLDFSLSRTSENEILALVKMQGWVQYTKRKGWHVCRTWLVGKDVNSGWFSIQVAGSCKSVDDALDWIKPAIVKKAEQENRTVYRQGDVYFVQMKRNCEIGDLPAGHEAEKTENGYIIKHNEHTYLSLDGHNWKSCIQKSVFGRVAD